MKTTALTFMLTAAGLTSLAQSVTISVKNPTSVQRHEVIAIETSRLGLPAPICQDSLTVLDAFGVEKPHQLTSDGQLLVYASVRPNGEAHYTVKSSPSQAQEYFVYGRLHPERFDDIAFENDRIGYRVYGPALQQQGERGFGIDVWLKRSPSQVLDTLYARDKRGEESFHIDHGLGMDCYGVGPTLGCGTPALIGGDGNLCFPWCYATYQILDNGPLRFRVQLDFLPTAAAGSNAVTEHRLLTLDRGSNFCRQTVWYDGLSHPTDLAAGLVIHTADTTSLSLGQNRITYADPTVDPEHHQCQVYVAVAFPYGVDDTRKIMYAQPEGGISGHAIGVMRGLTDNKPVTYYFGAAWSDYDVRSLAEWQLRTDLLITCIQHPLVVTIQKHSVSK